MLGREMKYHLYYMSGNGGWPDKWIKSNNYLNPFINLNEAYAAKFNYETRGLIYIVVEEGDDISHIPLYKSK